jgi:hypothetical protein
MVLVVVAVVAAVAGAVAAVVASAATYSRAALCVPPVWSVEASYSLCPLMP